VFLLLVVGFLLALILSWAYELTPEGVKKERDVDRSDSVTRVTGRKLDFFIIAALTLALVFVVIDQYVLEQPAPTTTISEDLRSIAVLPFTNRSAEEENAAFFADGVHDELLTRLSKIGDLKVISRTSVLEYRDTTKNMRQIGDELGVGSILEGGVQRAGNTVRINVQLINAQTDEHLWANTYDRELSASNIFAIQSEISTSIANALRAKLSPDEQERIAEIPTQNVEALEAYFAGQQMLYRRDAQALQSAIKYFERAIKLNRYLAIVTRPHQGRTRRPQNLDPT
jgi:TolB-like protein